MKINLKYDYRPLERVEINSVRHYLVDGTPVPSVTTILSKTKDAGSEKALAAWRERVGEEEAAAILEKSLSIGTALHKNIEDFIMLGEKPANGNVQVKAMTKAMLNLGVSKLDEVWGCEVPVYYPELYAGTSDLIGVYKGKTSIVDFKNSRKMKKRQYIEDYFIQCAAYKMAHDAVYGTEIEQFVILMVSQEFEFGEFIVSGEEVNKYLAAWITRLDKFYQ